MYFVDVYPIIVKFLAVHFITKIWTNLMHDSFLPDKKHYIYKTFSIVFEVIVSE